MSDCDSDRVVLVCCVAVLLIILFIVAAGLAALLIWVGARKPACTVEHFQVSALTNTTNATSFTLKLQNRNKDAGVYYDDLNLAFYYEPNNTNNRSSFIPVGNTTLLAFDQGGGKESDIQNSFNSISVDRWKREALKDIAANKTPMFRVDLKTTIKYKVILWKTKNHRVEVGADVPVDRNGTLVLQKGFFKKKGVKLTSGTGKDMPSAVLRGLLVLVGGLLVS